MTATTKRPTLTNAADIIMALQVIIPAGQVTELRVLNANTDGRDWISTYSGYFDNIGKLANEAGRIRKATGFYYVFNPIVTDLLARAANRIIKQGKGSATSDRDIIRRIWLPIDADAIRPAGISATDAEHELARARCREIRDHLATLGWPDPLALDSGNGGHLMYRIDLPADDDGLVKRCLLALAERFTDNVVKVDTSVFNPARIWKLPGTLACKGDSTPDRPHRMAGVLYVPKSVDVVAVDLLEGLASSVTSESKPSSNGRQKRTSSTTSTGTTGPVNGSKILKRCLAYLDKCDDAVAGQGGHDVTYRAACVAWRFGLPDDDALEAMRWFNRAKCKPEWTDDDLQHKLADALTEVVAAGEFGSMVEDDLPEVVLPGGGVTIRTAATELGKLLGATGIFYQRGRQTHRLLTDGLLKWIKPAELASDFESVAALRRWRGSGDDVELVPATCSKANAELIGSCFDFGENLPEIRAVAPCAVLVRSGDNLEVATGYHAGSKVLAHGEPPEDVEFGDAIKLLGRIVADFDFVSEGDRSRALAAMITPALVFGGLLGARAPVDLGEADESQSGKGYRHKLTCAVYGCEPATVTQRKSGVGSMEESFSTTLISGAPFISLDNVRGVIDSPALESFLTEPNFLARTPHKEAITIDPTRVVVMMTSNRAEVTRDLANRSSCVRIRKRPMDYQFCRYREGDILAHIKANQPTFLGAVFAVVRDWFDQGAPVNKATDHDFRRWAGVLDWIITQTFQATPLMVGHRDRKRLLGENDRQRTHWTRPRDSKEFKGRCAGSTFPRRPGTSATSVAPEAVVVPRR